VTPAQGTVFAFGTTVQVPLRHRACEHSLTVMPFEARYAEQSVSSALKSVNQKKKTFQERI
jgi:hypothetical protein